MSKRKVCVVLVDRANYGRMKPVMQAIDEHPQLTMQTVCAGTMVLERFGQAVSIVRGDGFSVDGELHTELEGSTPTTMAKSVGFGVSEFASEFHRLKPDVVVLIGDRFEALAAAVAAAYMNIPLVHLQGGEVSGSIDESARHAISKFAQFHCPATQRAAEYLVRMGERPETILSVGCPSSDIARTLDLRLSEEVINDSGSGAEIDINKPFLLCVFHPTTTEFGGARDEMECVLTAIEDVRTQTVLLWPNIDAGSDRISKTIRRFRLGCDKWLRTITNLSPEDYLRVLARAACAVGNSSSFVRDAGYFGTPVVLVGNRQNGRETDEHAFRVPASPVGEIDTALRNQLTHGRYTPSTLYGDGYVSPRIAEAIATVELYTQKQLAYVSEVLA